MKKIPVLFLAFAFLMLLPAYISASDKPVEAPDVKFIVNNRPVKLADVPLGISGRTLLPLRETLVSLGVPDDGEHIKWDAKDRSVTVVYGGSTIYLKLDSKTALVNGKTAVLDVAPIGYAPNQKVYIPVGFISNAVGKEVVWDRDTRTVLIKDRDKYAEMKSVLNKIDAAMNGIEKVRLTSRMKLNIAKQGSNINLDASLKEELDKKAGVLRSVTEMPLFGGNVSFSAFYRENAGYIKEASGGSWKKTPMKESDFKALLSEDVSLAAINSLEVMAASLERSEAGKKGEYLLTGALYPVRLASGMAKRAGVTDLSPENCRFEAALDEETDLVKSIHAEFSGKAGPVNSKSAVTAVVDVEYADYNGTFEIATPEDLPAS